MTEIGDRVISPHQRASKCHYFSAPKLPQSREKEVCAKLSYGTSALAKFPLPHQVDLRKETVCMIGVQLVYIESQIEK